MVEIVIFNPKPQHYAAAIRERMPNTIVHAAETLPDALACCANADVLVALAPDIPDALIAAMPKLRWVQALTTGVDNLLTTPSLAPDVRISSARGIHGPQMAEMAFVHMLTLSRDLPRMSTNQSQARWERWPQRLLFGKTAVLVGVGSISEETAQRCKAFGMHVTGISDSRTEAPGFDRIAKRSALLHEASQADFLIVLVPLDASTKGMIGADVFAAMKPTGIVINLARGPVVDEAALIAALREHQIGGAGLDVLDPEPPSPDNPLWHMPNVFITPHVGGMSDTYAQQVTPLLLLQHGRAHLLVRRTKGLDRGHGCTEHA